MSIEEQNWDLEAAEYVLGTLSDQDRKVYDALYKVDSDWQKRVHRWQARLNPLHDTTSPVEPPEYVLTTVLDRINDGFSSGVIFAEPVDVPAVEVPARESELSLPPLEALAQLKERVGYWQMATLLAVACMAALLVLGPRYLELRAPKQPTVRTVAVLQGQANEPLWAVSYYRKPTQQQNAADSLEIVSVTAIGKPQLSDEQSHQLWMVLPEGGGVRSVGLMPNESGGTATFELPVSLDEAAEFAVSLEPSGGVTGPEHGPVVTRTFIVKAPVQSDI